MLALGVAGASAFFFTNLRSELAPVEDRGTITAIGVAPEGATLAFTADYARRVEDYFRNIQEVETYLVIVGFPDVTRAIAFARLKPWEQRQRKQQDRVT